MGLNDQQEKLRQAKEWLSDPKLLVTDEKFKAAWEYVQDVYRTAENCEVESQAVEIMAMVMGKDWLN